MNVSTPADQGLSLNKGEILQGTVQTIKDGGLLTLLLKGRMIEAVSQVPVNTGEELFLQVDGFRDGRVFLKVLTPLEIQQAQSVNLASSLIDMGFSPGEDNLLMAQALLDHKLPVTPEHLISLSRAALILGGINEKNLQAAAFTLSRGLKMDQQILPALKQLLNPNQSLARIVESLLKNIALLEEQALQGKYPAEKAEALVRQAGNNSGDMNKSAVLTTERGSISGTNNTVVSEGRASISRSHNPVLSQVSELTSRTNNTAFSEGREFTGRTNTIGISSGNQNDVLPIVRQPAIPENYAVAQGTAEETRVESANPAVQAAIMPAGREEIASALIKQLPFLKDLIEQITIKIQDGTGEAVQKLKEMFYSERDLIRGIMILEEIAKSQGETQKNSIINEFLTRLETLDRELLGPKIFNFSSRGLPDNNANSYYFSVPVQIDDKIHLCELRLNKEVGSKGLQDLENIKLLVALETEQMGRVLFHINWHRRGSMELQGIVENTEVKEHLQKNLAVLLSSLEKLGYIINNQGIKVAENPAENQSIKTSLLNNTEKTQRFSIDIII